MSDPRQFFASERQQIESRNVGAEPVQFALWQRTGGDDEPVKIRVGSVGVHGEVAQQVLAGFGAGYLVESVDQYQPGDTVLGRRGEEPWDLELVLAGHRPGQGFRQATAAQGLPARDQGLCRDEHRYGRGRFFSAQAAPDTFGEPGAQEAGLACAGTCHDDTGACAGQDLVRRDGSGAGHQWRAVRVVPVRLLVQAADLLAQVHRAEGLRRRRR